jgi:hypothetical protein
MLTRVLLFAHAAPYLHAVSSRPLHPLSHGADITTTLPSQLVDAASKNDMAKAQQLLARRVNVTFAAHSLTSFHMHVPVPLLGCVVEAVSLGAGIRADGNSDGNGLGLECG